MPTRHGGVDCVPSEPCFYFMHHPLTDHRVRAQPKSEIVLASAIA